MKLTGKVAVVTGGGGVLCGCMAKALACDGAKVAVLSLRQESADAVAKEIADQGGQAVAIACNVLEQSSVIAAKDEVLKAFGQVDILINGAGGNNPKANTTGEIFDPADVDNPDAASFFDLGLEGFKAVFDLNFIGSFLTSQVFCKEMLGRSGVIINISSVSAPSPMTKVPAYSAAKAAIENFTQWMAVHMAPANIRVNAITPGFFLTNQNRRLLLDAEGNYTERSKKILSHTPMGRFGKPEDLVGAMLWLVDNNTSAFVTGIAVPVDGGFLAYSGV